MRFFLSLAWTIRKQCTSLAQRGTERGSLYGLAIDQERGNVTVKFISIGRKKNFTQIGGAKFIISATSRTGATESSISAMLRIRLSGACKLSSAVSAYVCLFFFWPIDMNLTVSCSMKRETTDLNLESGSAQRGRRVFAHPNLDSSPAHARPFFQHHQHSFILTVSCL
jgi:hypothetical protein